MREVAELVTAARALRERGEPYVTATVVEVQGSSYRRPGARLICSANGRAAGSISGGCLEAELIRTAFWHTRNGPIVRRFDSTDPDESVLGCGGIVDVLLERSCDGTDELFALVSETVAAEARAAIATVFRSSDPAIPVGARAWTMDGRGAGHLIEGSHRELARRVFPRGWDPERDGERPLPASARQVRGAEGAIEVLIESVAPPPHLFVLGSGPDAVPLVLIARKLGWTVTVWDAVPSYQTAARFAPNAATLNRDLSAIAAEVERSDTPMIVVMGHNRARDRLALDFALKSRARYIGVLGPRRRTAALSADLAEQLNDPRLRSPVGLDLGAETPEEIAVSIASEMLGCIRGAGYVPLRQRGTIHAEVT